MTGPQTNPDAAGRGPAGTATTWGRRPCLTAEELVAALGRWSAGDDAPPALLAARLRQLLLDDGQLPPGTRLPPERELADALTVGRVVVASAYEQLRQEGHVERRQGVGTWVSDTPRSISRDRPANQHPSTSSPKENIVAAADGPSPA